MVCFLLSASESLPVEVIYVYFLLTCIEMSAGFGMNSNFFDVEGNSLC